MRQVKRFIYFLVLNIIISVVTILLVLKWWESKHPTVTDNSTPVVIVVTPTQSVILPMLTNNTTNESDIATDTGVVVTGTLRASPTFGLLSYRVKEGDSLGALAIQFNVSIADIMAVNGLTDPNSLYAGQIINIPTAPLPTETLSPTPTRQVSATPQSSATHLPSATDTPAPTQVDQAPQVVIDGVIGAGVLESEKVRLQRTGEGELSLAGWRLEDGTGNVYTFPQLTLYQDGAINLNTRSGLDTVVDLYWGLTTPIWQAGKTVSLYDAEKQLRASYTIP